jgi:oligoendopeptidase F
VAATPGDGWGWITIPHLVHYRFYCYSYAFGMLLVFALYRQWERDGAAFVPRYLELLAAGGSDTPVELLRRMGIDLLDAAFWARGLDVLADLIEQFRAEVK